jgi:hypothetical protein
MVKAPQTQKQRCFQALVPHPKKGAPANLDRTKTPFACYEAAGPGGNLSTWKLCV